MEKSKSPSFLESPGNSSINQDYSEYSTDTTPIMTDADTSLPHMSNTHKQSDIQYAGVAVNTLPPGTVPAYRAVFLIANAALGAGLLNFPQAYMRAGGVEIAISMQFGLLLFIIGAFLILARCANHSQATTYQDVILFMLGRRVKEVTQIFIAIYFFGSAITYMIIIGEQLSSVSSVVLVHSLSLLLLCCVILMVPTVKNKICQLISSQIGKVLSVLYL